MAARQILVLHGQAPMPVESHLSIWQIAGWPAVLPKAEGVLAEPGEAAIFLCRDMGCDAWVHPSGHLPSAWPGVCLVQNRLLPITISPPK